MANTHGSKSPRRSLRLVGYDYAQAGAYFVTLCTHNRECLFGEIEHGIMKLSDTGRVVADEWLKSGTVRREIVLDEWVVMPNHFHAIIVITEHPDVKLQPIRLAGTGDREVIREGRGDRLVALAGAPIPPVTATGPQPHSVGAMIAGFKSAVTKRVNTLRQTPGATLWQRNYWEHIIRNAEECSRIQTYIQNNPCQWQQDSLNPGKQAKQ